MICQAVDTGNPYLWIFLTGCFLGISIAQSTMPAENPRAPGRRRGWKWAWVYIFASFFLASALAGFFMAGLEAYQSRGMIYYGGAVVCVSALAFRFKKWAGIPIVTLVIIFIVYFGFITFRFECNAANEDAGWFRVLDYDEGNVKVEADNGTETAIIDIPGGKITPLVTVLTVDRKYLLYGGKILVLFSGISKDVDSYRGQNVSSIFYPEDTVVNQLGIERFARRLPGIDYHVLSVPPFRPAEFQRYRVRVSEESGTPVLRVGPLL